MVQELEGLRETAAQHLGRLVSEGGITPNTAAKVRNSLSQYELWLTLDKQRLIAGSHLDRASSLLLWQADVVDRGKPNQGDAAGLRALAETIQDLRDGDT